MRHLTVTCDHCHKETTETHHVLGFVAGPRDGQDHIDLCGPCCPVTGRRPGQPAQSHTDPERQGRNATCQGASLSIQCQHEDT